MTTTLHNAVDDVLDRLGDLDNDLWSRDEISLYYRDGYDQFCRITKCLFDYWVIENIPVTANWQTDLEKYLMEQKPGRALTDARMGYTAEHEKNLGVGGRYGGSKGVDPAPATAVADKAYFEADSTGSVDSALPKIVSGGDLPRGVVDLVCVYYDRRRLVGTTTAQLRKMNPVYETTSTGDPQFWAWDKDGLYYLRVSPRMTGGATYVTVNGQWGFMRQTDATVTEVTKEIGGRSTEGFGILRYEEGSFPVHGPWGTPTRMHPSDENVEVELFRLGLDLDKYPVELPDAYKKYCTFYAMHKALERPGHGQDMELSQHYATRFMMGVDRMIKKRQNMDQEYIGALGGGTGEHVSFGLGDPQPPYQYLDMEAPE